MGVTMLALSGMTGSGKTTIARALLQELEGSFMVPSTTDRKPREDDLPNEYEYLTKSEMAELKERARGTRKNKIRTLWTEERPSGHSYVTRHDAVEAALARKDGYGIMILVPRRVETLYWYLEYQRETSVALIPFFIRSFGLDVLRERVSTRTQNIADFEKVWPEERDWEALARRSVAGFTFIDNSGEGVAEAIGQIKNRLDWENDRRSRARVG